MINKNKVTIHKRELATSTFKDIIVGTIFLNVPINRVLIKVDEHIKLPEVDSYKEKLIDPLMYPHYNAIDLETGEHVYYALDDKVVLADSNIDVKVRV